MEGLAAILTACLVIFLYLHISFHLKISSETEVLEVGVETKRELEEACGLRQPLLFNYSISDNLQFSQNASVQDASGALFEEWRNALNDGKQTRFTPFACIDTHFLCPPMTAYTSTQIVAGHNARTPVEQLCNGRHPDERCRTGNDHHATCENLTSNGIAFHVVSPESR